MVGAGSRILSIKDCLRAARVLAQAMLSSLQQNGRLFSVAFFNHILGEGMWLVGRRPSSETLGLYLSARAVIFFHDEPSRPGSAVGARLSSIGSSADSTPAQLVSMPTPPAAVFADRGDGHDPQVSHVVVQVFIFSSRDVASVSCSYHQPSAPRKRPSPAVASFASGLKLARISGGNPPRLTVMMPAGMDTFCISHLSCVQGKTTSARRPPKNRTVPLTTPPLSGPAAPVSFSVSRNLRSSLARSSRNLRSSRI
mmetsp:Transcript_30072/g.94210  ORF Transcript_30072/g.94210 Transcript_30072/m.94210 type:complete len:254 (+) Transcript_30072:238-999(+)